MVDGFSGLRCWPLVEGCGVCALDLWVFTLLTFILWFYAWWVCLLSEFSCVIVIFVIVLCVVIWACAITLILCLCLADFVT